MFLTGITGTMPGWFYFVTLTVILTINGAPASKLGALTFTVYPSALRWAFAPFVDTYYIEKLGRRKTWMFLMSLIMAFISFVQIFYLNEWVEE